MKVLSLFDGISCGMVALERAGILVDTYYSSEIDKNAIDISEKNYKNIIRLGDVTKWKEWNLPKIDIVIGGSPCQGFSRAGKCLNFNDPRSKLFFEFLDILNHIKKSNPSVLFLLENVKMKNEWKDVISEHLGVQPIEINSCLVSGQNRSRLYWTNIEGVEQPKDRNINLGDILQTDIRHENYISRNGILFEPTFSEASMDLVNVVNGEVRIKQATTKGYIVAENGDGVNLSFPSSKSRRGRVIKRKSSTLDCACNIGVLKDGIIRRFTVRELEKLQTLPEGYTEGFPKTISKKAIGNGWTVDVIAHIFTYLKKEIEAGNENQIKFNDEESFNEIVKECKKGVNNKAV